MPIPGFRAEHAIGPVLGYRSVRATAPGGGIAPSLGRLLGGASSGAFWPCFRNCYDRCIGDTGPCMNSCYYLCNWNPNIWF
jgi:hypothetical protein